MIGLSVLLDPPSSGTWASFAFGATLGLTAQLFPYLRRGFHRWRLARRLARDPWILREELNEYRQAEGEELQPLEMEQVVVSALIAGFALGVPAWLASEHHENWWRLGVGAYLAAIAVFTIWRRFNDPEPKPLVFPDAHVPREAVIGFVTALGSVAVLLAVLFSLF